MARKYLGCLNLGLGDAQPCLPHLTPILLQQAPQPSEESRAVLRVMETALYARGNEAAGIAEVAGCHHGPRGGTESPSEMKRAMAR